MFKRQFSYSANRGFLRKLNKTLVRAAPREHVVEQLVKPVGLPAAPSSSTVYREGTKMRDMFSEAKTSRRAEELAHEMSRSGMYDVYTFRKTGGKLFLSPPSYWRADKAHFFPHLVGRALSGDKLMNVDDVLRDKLSVVKISSVATGEQMVRTYFEQGDHSYLKDDSALSTLACGNSGPRTQVVELTLPENWFSKWVVRLSLGRLRSVVPPERHSKWFICDREQLPFQIREALHINNPYTGYVFVVDGKLRIRWMACGKATPKDYELLWSIVKRLQHEMDETTGLRS